jgi:hypothetical protein
LVGLVLFSLEDLWHETNQISEPNGPRPLTAHRTSHRDRPRPRENVDRPGSSQKSWLFGEGHRAACVVGWTELAVGQ